MKVLNLSEFIKLSGIEQNKYLSNIIDFLPVELEIPPHIILNDTIKVFIYNVFLSQEFKPELWVKYFKWFTYHYMTLTEYNMLLFTTWDFEVHKNHLVAFKSGVENVNIPYPKTFDKFINICKDELDIELEWNL